ncbi:MAG: tyrosine-type recombinase/integrase [Myxococcota bacterium]
MAGDVGKVYPERSGGQVTGYVVAVWAGDKGERRRLKLRHVPLPDGKTFVRITTRKVAEAVLEQVQRAIANGVPPFAACSPFMKDKAPELLFRRCWERFCEAKDRQGRAGRQLSAKRIAELHGHLSRGNLDAIADKPAHQIRTRDLEALRDTLLERLSPKSVHHVLADIRTCLRWLEDGQEIQGVPRMPSVRVPEHAPTIPGPGDVQRLLDAIPWRLRGQWLARSQLGLRPSEAQRLNVADWRFEPEVFRLRDGTEAAAHLLTVRGKGGLVRVLPVPPSWEVAVWIGEHADPRDALRGDAAPLFTNPHAAADENPAGRWTKASSRRVWLAACRACDLMQSEWRPRYAENESMRHAFATHSGNSGAELLAISRFLGHRDPRTTNLYLKSGPAALLDVVKG